LQYRFLDPKLVSNSVGVGVHISAIDLGMVGFGPTTDPMPIVMYKRVGNIADWPEQITNMP
jgi:hypothetical protein